MLTAANTKLRLMILKAGIPIEYIRGAALNNDSSSSGKH